MSITQDLRDCMGYANGGHLVQRFLECHLNSDAHQWETLVQWLGFYAAGRCPGLIQENRGVQT